MDTGIRSKFFARALNGVLTTTLVATVAIVVSSQPVPAQTTGTILGRVLDPSGAALVNAEVAATNVGTGLVRNAVTNVEGMYRIPTLPLGSYEVSVLVTGFQRFTQSGITLQVGQNARVDAPMQLGEVIETVTVEAAAVSVDTQGTTIGATVNRLRLQNIPLNGRNILSLAQLLPGVGTGNISTAITFSRSGPTITVSGARRNENNMMLDGSTFLGNMGNTGQNLPSPDALTEFRVLTNTYSAEYGRGGGGIFLAVSKSGTNEVHGGVWEFLRNDTLNARNWFAASIPKLRQNQFGFSLGGPVKKNKTFLFGSYQGLRVRQENLRTSFPLSQMERAGDFSASPNPILDPNTGDPFPNNLIPPGRLDILSKNLLAEYVPTPNQPDGRYFEARSQPIDANQYIIKVDHYLSESDTVTFRYYRNKDASANWQGGDALALAGGVATELRNWSLSETHIFGPSLLSETRFSWHRLDSGFEASGANKTARQLGGNFNQDGEEPAVPWINISGRSAVSGAFNLKEPDDVIQFSQNVSWVHGRHTTKFGGQVFRLRHLTRTPFQSSGGFSFDGGFSGNAAADYILGRPSNLFMQSILEDASRAGNYHLFVQEDFQVHPQLTMNFGLRYELNTPWVQIRDWTGTIRPFAPCSTDCQQSQLWPGAPPGFVYPGDSGVPRGLMPTDKNNFGPRIGLAFDPFGDGRTSIRAAYGIFYAYTGAIVSATVNQALPFVLPLQLSPPPSFSDPFAGRTDPFPYTQDSFVFPAQFYTVDNNFRAGYAQQFNFNVQHQLGADLVVEAGYFGRVGHQLSAVREANSAVFGPGATAANTQSRRPFFPEFYSSVSSIHADGNSNYHALQAKAEKRFSKGYTFQFAYTLAKSIDNRSRFSVDGGGVQDVNNYRDGERGLSNFHQKQLFAFNGIWELPFFKDRGFVSQILGGWQLTGTVRMAGGLPFAVTSGSDVALTGPGRNVGAQRPNTVGDGKLDTGRSHGELVDEYFNTAAFVRPETGTFGSTGRNPLVGPGFSQADLAVQKMFYLPRESLGRIEFRAEFFNLVNRVNFNNPAGNLASPSFGGILSARDARIVQFGLRYDF
jgi:hypothetical protein